jgi:hypothetical protein
MKKMKIMNEIACNLKNLLTFVTEFLIQLFVCHLGSARLAKKQLLNFN